MPDLVLVENGVRLSKDRQVDTDGLMRAIVDVVAIHAWSPTEAEAAGVEWKPGYVCWELRNVREVIPAIPCPARSKIYSIEFGSDLPPARRG